MPQHRKDVGRLVLNRRPGERIFIGDDIVIEVDACSFREVKIAISAPRSIRIDREERVANR